LRGGNHAGVGERSDEALPFVVDEPEGLVLDEWSAGGCAEIVADVRILRAGGGWIEKIAGAQSVVAPEPIDVAVEIVGTAAGKDLDDGAIVAAIFRA